MTSPILVAVFTVAYLAVTAWLCRGLKLSARNLAMGGLACALTLILGSIMIPLPTGASITCGSWIPLMLLAVVCDRRLAFVSGWVCGILAMVLIPAWQPVHWAQIFVEHLVCFSCLGYTGIFGTDKRWKILCGGILAIFIKFWAHVFSGVIFFSQNAVDAADCMMACLPCMLSYGWIFGEMLKNVPGVQNTPYARFVNDYAGERYESICKAWEAFTEKVCASIPPEREAHCLEIFRTCSEHERHFWEMAARPRTDFGGAQA